MPSLSLSKTPSALQDSCAWSIGASAAIIFTATPTSTSETARARTWREVSRPWARRHGPPADLKPLLVAADAELMLVLSRKREQSIMIGDEIEVIVVDIRGDRVRLGITAPKTVPVDRREVYEAKKRDRGPAETQPDDAPSEGHTNDP